MKLEGAVRIGSALRTLSASLLFGLGFSSIVSVATNASAAAAPTPVTIKGAGSDSLFRYSTTFADDLSGAAKPVDLQYVGSGDTEGKRAFLAGERDFLISGLPLTDAEAASVPGGVVKLPIAVSTMAFLMHWPNSTLDWYVYNTQLPGCDPADPAFTGDRTCYDIHVFSGDTAHGGAVPVPNAALATMAMSGSPPGHPSPAEALPEAGWNDPPLLTLWSKYVGKPIADLVGNRMIPWWIHRSEGSAYNFYMQELMQQAAHAAWLQMGPFRDAKTKAPPTISDRIPLVFSRQGVEQQVASLGNGDSYSFVGGGGIAGNHSGIITDGPPSAIGYAQETFPAVQSSFRYIEVQNASGDWVLPTADAIDKALEAGAQTPLYALTNKVPGAYPMVWVDNLYLPKTGLSVDKTNALAAYIRYMATAGQAVVSAPLKAPTDSNGKMIGTQPLSEGHLTKAMAATAIAAADDFVRSNCVGADRRITNDPKPGPYAPALDVVTAIGPSVNCQAIVATPPTTTAAPTTTVPVTAAPTTAAPTTIATVPSVVRTVTVTRPPVIATEAPAPTTSTLPPTTIPTTVPKTTTAPKPVATAPPKQTTLPMSLPSKGGGGLDRFSTMLIGSFGFLGLRGPVGRRLSGLR